MRTSPPQRGYQSVLAAVVDRCFDRLEARAVRTRPTGERNARYDGKVMLPDSPPCGFQHPDPPQRFFDVSLLFRRMKMLQIGRKQLADDDPLLFRELQGLCTLCRSKEQCAVDCTHEFDDTRWDKWREYCPNATTLTTLGAVQNCALAAQHLKIPRATGFLESRGLD